MAHLLSGMGKVGRTEATLLGYSVGGQIVLRGGRDIMLGFPDIKSGLRNIFEIKTMSLEVNSIQVLLNLGEYIHILISYGRLCDIHHMISFHNI